MKGPYAGLVLLMIVCMTMKMTKCFSGNVRPAAVAGQFYPADRQELETDVKQYLSAATKAGLHVPVRAVIVPHAGYVFSGQTAAEAFAQLDPKVHYDHIFLLGPSHHIGLDGASVATAWGAYQTPLGTVRVDTALCQHLVDENKVLVFEPRAHDREHCLEVELPFLQVQLGEVPPIVPVIIGTEDYYTLQDIARALVPYFTPRNLFVISSDFSHYPCYDDAERVDKRTGDAVASGSLHAFLRALSDNADEHVRNLATSACGQAAIAVLLMMAEKEKGLEMHHLAYCNSGDSPYSGHDQVVGYHAFVMTAKGDTVQEETTKQGISKETSKDEGNKKDVSIEAKMKKEKTEDDKSDEATATHAAAKSDIADEPFVLSDSTRKQLLDIAWKSVRRQQVAAPTNPELLRKGGAFVTLTENGRLRGCIGHFGEDVPLWQVVEVMAHDAAYRDPRFQPVTPEEWDRLSIEISVLSPLKRIHDISEFHYGEEGIYIKKGWHSGTFLPQVAEEVNWTKEEFLGHCARDKAGLPWDGWKDAELYTYKVEIVRAQ
jgi:AmmeMemoRadiSam system protein B/AmmeMemoRadiSam system protein A